MSAEAAGSQVRSALVTGASGGIGRAIAGRLAASGFQLTLSGRDADALNQLARELGNAGAGVRIAPADMASGDEVRSLARSHSEQFGALDLLVLCAGTGTSGSVADYPVHRFDRQVAVNLRGPFLLLQQCLPDLRRAAARHPAHGARIAAITSITGVVSEPGLGIYGATKAALISLCESVNVEESLTGVSATAISPGYVDTEMSAWVRQRVDPGDMIEPDDIAELVAVLTRLSARAIVPGIVVTRPGTALWRA